MISYESKVAVARPPEVVFEYLIEPSKQALWSDVPMRQVTPGPLTTGSKMEVTFAGGPLKAVIGLELTAVEPGRRMAFRSYSGPIGWTGEYRLEPRGDATELSQEGHLEFKGWWRPLEAIVGAEIRSGEIKELEKLKSVIETG